MPATISKTRKWASYIMSGVVILFMLMDSVMKFIKPREVVEGTIELGFVEQQIVVLGVLAMLSTVLYIIPRTSVLGAILLTAYFGGAIATHMRLSNPLLTHTLFTLYFGILTWGGLWLRNPKLQALLPFTRSAQS